MYTPHTTDVSFFQRIVHVVTCHPLATKISTRINNKSESWLKTSPKYFMAITPTPLAA